MDVVLSVDVIAEDAADRADRQLAVGRKQGLPLVNRRARFGVGLAEASPSTHGVSTPRGDRELGRCLASLARTGCRRHAGIHSDGASGRLK